MEVKSVQSIALYLYLLKNKTKMSFNFIIKMFLERVPSASNIGHNMFAHVFLLQEVTRISCFNGHEMKNCNYQGLQGHGAPRSGC